MILSKHSRHIFHPDADFVFCKRMVIGDGEVMPGDPVPKGLLHKGKLRAFWKAGVIGYPRIPVEKAPEKLPAVAEKVGGGWYRVTLPDGSQKKVRKAGLNEYNVEEIV